MSRRLEGKVALITGGASGLGEAAAKLFVTEGAQVVIADLSAKRGAVAEALGDAAAEVRADVSQEDDVRAMVAFTLEHFGRIDVLCNNAGVDGDIVPTGEMPSESFDRIVGINLRGVFLGHRYGIPAMLESGGGSVINTASIAALGAMPGAAGYCASKAGVVALTKVAAVEYAQAGVRANVICPGVIRTPILDGIGENNPTLAAAIAAIPMGRIGQADEIAHLSAFLASDESSYMTGTVLPVDGGYVAV